MQECDLIWRQKEGEKLEKYYNWITKINSWLIAINDGPYKPADDLEIQVHEEVENTKNVTILFIRTR